MDGQCHDVVEVDGEVVVDGSGEVKAASSSALLGDRGWQEQQRYQTRLGHRN